MNINPIYSCGAFCLLLLSFLHLFFWLIFYTPYCFYPSRVNNICNCDKSVQYMVYEVKYYAI